MIFRDRAERRRLDSTGWYRIPIGAGLIGTGFLLTVVGTFLAWVESGGLERNSYAMAGLLERLDLIDNDGIRFLLVIWPVVGPLCLLPMLAAILRRWRIAGLAAAVVGVAVGGVAIAVIWYAAGRSWLGVTLVLAGPMVTVAGASLLLAGGLVLSGRSGGSRFPAT